MSYAESPVESQNEGILIHLRDATRLPLLSYVFQLASILSVTRQTSNIVYYIRPIPFASLWGAGKVLARLVRSVLLFAVVSQFVLSGMSGITSHLASQAHLVARNTHSIASAVCALPVPFKNSICTRITDEPVSPFNLNHPFLINEDVHGPAIDFAIRKTANAMSVVLALVRASDLPQRHELSDKIKDFLQRAWACELTSGAHLALVKTTIDE
jgi:hypothetical protein